MKTAQLLSSPLSVGLTSTAINNTHSILLSHNNTTTHNNRFTALCPGLPGWASTRRNTHTPTILIIIQSLSASSIYHNPKHPPGSNYVLSNLFVQPVSMSSLVYLLVWSPPPHIPFISSPNQCLVFAAHAHTIATCFAVVSILCHLFLVFLSTPYLELVFYLNITHPTKHNHLILFPDRPSLTSV